MKLLNHFELKKPMVSCHRHNEDARAPQLVERMLAEDLTVALTCDAGTPGISDPGHSRAYLQHLFKVGDPQAMRLATAHNLRFYGRLMEYLRDE